MSFLQPCDFGILGGACHFRCYLTDIALTSECGMMVSCTKWHTTIHILQMKLYHHAYIWWQPCTWKVQNTLKRMMHLPEFNFIILIQFKNCNLYSFTILQTIQKVMSYVHSCYWKLTDTSAEKTYIILPNPFYEYITGVVILATHYNVQDITVHFMIMQFVQLVLNTVIQHASLFSNYINNKKLIIKIILKINNKNLHIHLHAIIHYKLHKLHSLLNIFRSSSQEL